MSDLDAALPSHRTRRILAAVFGGLCLDVIADDENLPAGDVERAVQDELGRRWVAPPVSFAKIQIARLESLLVDLTDRLASGDLTALDRALKVIDRLDRYHGFERGNAAVRSYGEDHRERLLAKLNAIAANLADAPAESAVAP